MRKIYLLTLFVSAFFIGRSQNITVTAPNGGEVLYACQTYTITWNATGTSNFYDIDYSLNNGAIWASVASNLNVTNGQYVWTVPKVESSTCLVRVRDKNNNTIEDVSNNVFTIHIPVIVTSPNGGETWQAGSQHPITWNIQGTSLRFDILYSINGGTTYSVIAANVSSPTGTYNWTVPNTPSATCVVKVWDADQSCMQDVSDNNFTITPAQPLLTYPNGGQTFNWNQPINITWDATTFYTTVRLEYSTDNGLTWTVISSATTNDGTQAWTVPSNINSTQCLIKASNSTDVNSNDVSNAVFSILAPRATVITPNGGESWLACENKTISFSVSGTTYLPTYTAEVRYSINGGSTWSLINTVTNPSASVPSNVSFTAPNTVSSTQCLVRVISSAYPTIADTSDAFFSIQPQPLAITVTSPNGGEVLPALGNTTITWTNTAAASGLYNIFYSSDGSSFTTLATGVSGNAYSWTNIPNVPSSTYLVRVSDNANSCRFDVSDANFTVAGTQPLLTAPNGGQVYQWGQPVNITWVASTFSSTVRLEYSIDNGTTWILISSGTTNDGTQAWTVPSNINSTQCLIRASNSANTALFDVSDAVFSIIAPGATVITPNGGESWLACESKTISFSVSGTTYLPTYTAEVRYSTNGGSTWSLINTVTNPSASVASNLSFTVPNNVSSTQCLVRVISSAYPTIADTSDAFFSIQPQPLAITVTSPNGGEVLPALGSTTITWTNTAAASGLYDIAYSSNGTSFTTLATGVSGNAYTWTNIPNVPTTTYLVRVRDNANSCRVDVSDANFTVTAPQPLLTYPNGGQTFNWNQPINITWDATTFYTTVRLEYSTDNGLTWTVISSATTNDGTQAWTVPSNINSTQCLIKASNSTDVNSNDVSNAVFSILAPRATVITPNGGESWLACENKTISFSVTGTTYLPTYTVDVSYSTNGGSTWTAINTVTNPSASVASNVSYSFPNNINSTQCLMRVISSAYPTIADTSNAVFSIQPQPTLITVTSPNGGESLTGLTNQVITWSNLTGTSGLYDIAYSINNGTSFITIATGVSGNAYNWLVPNMAVSTTCLIRVRDNANSCREDVSDANFTINPAQPILTSPNGGELFWNGNNYNITWNTATFYTTVRLEYSLDSGATWTLIYSGTTNDGSQAWPVPNVSATKCLVRASNSDNINYNDVSNAVFNINPAVTIVTPNSGDSLGACTQTTISFIHSPAYTTFNIEYTPNGGTTWISIATNQTFGGTAGAYNWTVNNVPSVNVFVRVYPALSVSLADQNDLPFVIKPSVTLIQPNFGGTLAAGSVFPIKWNSDGISNLYDISYSTTGTAGPWINIVTGYNTSSNTYNWTVPNILSTNCYIRIADNVNSCKRDNSNYPFTIAASAQPINVTSSNGQDTLQGCQNYTIQWTESGAPIGSYNIDLSTNGGVTWSSIAASYTTTAGAYNWIVPNVITDLALVRVSSAINSTVFDASDAAFSIKTRNIIASRDTTICTAGNLQLNATGGLGTFAWTPALGLNNANIANPVATVNASIQYVVSSANGTCIISDTVLVTLAKPIKVTVEVNTPVVCAGATARFTAHATDALAATYQWKKNNVNIGTSDSVLLVTGLFSSDVITCFVTSVLPCVSNASSTGVTVTAYQPLGNDTSIAVSCINCTANLTALYNTAQYPTATWSTATPAAVRVGAYTLIVNGNSCRDTAVVNVNVSEANDLRGCAVGNFYVQSDINGTTYQWQQNSGNGFINITNNVTYTGANSAQLQVKNAPSSYYGYQYRCLVNGVNFSAVKTMKISTVWTGAVSNAWNVAGNWSCGRVPDANTDVYVYNGVTNYPVVTTAISCRSITAATGTFVTVNSGGSILLTGK